jgi:hypothetical protein
MTCVRSYQLLKTIRLIFRRNIRRCDTVVSADCEDVVDHFSTEINTRYVHITDLLRPCVGCWLIPITITYARDTIESSYGMHMPVVGDAGTSKLNFRNERPLVDLWVPIPLLIHFWKRNPPVGWSRAAFVTLLTHEGDPGPVVRLVAMVISAVVCVRAWAKASAGVQSIPLQSPIT